MSDFKDSAIKLFGMTIPLPVDSSLHDTEPGAKLRHQEMNRETSDEQEDPITTATSGVKEKPPKREITAQKKSENGREEEKQTSISQENTSKKPEKVLACPRCNSMDTKFCYYNNYNVNQPRHFCKKCQRYWTAGGTMRNVPVGAGRRKNKISTANFHYRQILISESLKTTHQQLQAAINGTTSTVLRFGSDSPLCESLRETDFSSEKQENHHNFAAQVSIFPWPYPWNSGFPVSFCPWNISNSPINKCTYTLGKHSRDGDILNHGNRQELPTLRIDHDPGEAAKSSIWETHKSIFDGDFQNKNCKKFYEAEKSLVLQANPAALSRSLNFHERS